MVGQLDDNLRDRLVAVTKGAAGVIPIVGGPLGELISETIPKQRVDRIVSYIRQLELRLATLENDKSREFLHDPAKIDLIETGGYQAARAISSQRIDQIVEVVDNGLKSSENDVIRRKRILNIFGELDDDEIAILNAYGQTYGGNRQNAWSNVERPSPSHMNAGTEVFDENALYAAGKTHLTRLGLLKQRFSSLKRGEYPEFDKNTGGFKGAEEISYLGRLLLREIGLASPIDRNN